jgi:hypothetical protein
MVKKYEISLRGFHTTQVRNTKAGMPRIPSIWGMSATGPKRSGKTVGRECGEEKAGLAADRLKN